MYSHIYISRLFHKILTNIQIFVENLLKKLWNNLWPRRHHISVPAIQRSLESSPLPPLPLSFMPCTPFSCGREAAGGICWHCICGGASAESQHGVFCQEEKQGDTTPNALHFVENPNNTKRTPDQMCISMVFREQIFFFRVWLAIRSLQTLGVCNGT